jgi:hypothetical protein
MSAAHFAVANPSFRPSGTWCADWSPTLASIKPGSTSVGVLLTMKEGCTSTDQSRRAGLCPQYQSGSCRALSRRYSGWPLPSRSSPPLSSSAIPARALVSDVRGPADVRQRTSTLRPMYHGSRARGVVARIGERSLDADRSKQLAPQPGHTETFEATEARCPKKR